MPGVKEIDDFVSHLQKNQDGDSKLCHVTNEQWSQPTDIHDIDSLCRFINNYVNKMHHDPKFVSNVLNMDVDKNSDKSKRRQKLDAWISLMRSFVGMKDEAGWHFNVHKAMCAVESVHGNVFGEVELDSVVAGSGSQKGLLELLKRGKGCKTCSVKEKKVVFLDDLMTTDEAKSSVLSL